jgi:signal peptide peptidase SppA
MNRPVVPHIEQYVGVWAVHEPALRQGLEHLRTLNLAEHIRSAQATVRRRKAAAAPQADDPPKKPYTVTPDGIAVFELTGMMTKYGSSLSAYRGSVRLQREIRQARADDDVRAALLIIDSPGGTVAGTEDLAGEVAAFAAVKPITAVIQDMGASGAYWVASQATRIVANGTAAVGSIGVYWAIEDTSGAYAVSGVKVHVVKAGEFKGAAVPGTEVTTKQLAEFQREVDDLHALFVAAVARGRGMTADEVTKLADGRVHIGAKAQALGLVDAIEGLDAAAAELRTRIETNDGRTAVAAPRLEDETMSRLNVETKEPAATPDKGTEAAAAPAPAAGGTGQSMAPTPAQPAAATPAELKAALPGASAEFRERCALAGQTLAQAKDAWLVELGAERDKLAAELAESTKAQAAAGAGAAVTRGGGETAAAEPTDRDGWEAQWKASAKLQAEHPSAKSYAAYKAAEARGAVKIISK